MAGGVLSGRGICGWRAKAVCGALLILLLLALSDGARASEDKAPVDLPGEAEVVAAEGAPVEEEPLHSVVDTAVETTPRHPTAAGATLGRTYQGLLRARRAGSLFLLACILAVYGAARWAQAGRLASEASAAAAARSQALQGTLAEYEAKTQLAEQLSKQLAEKRAGTSQFQAEVETAAKQTEEKEKELIAELLQHASQGVDTGSLMKALSEEAKILEDEAEEIRRRVQEFALPPAEGNKLLAQAREEQAELDAKRRQLMKKKEQKAAAETMWAEDLKWQREDLMNAIEKTTHELRVVEHRKLQMRVKIVDNMKRALAASPDPELKESLTQRLTALRLEVAERQAAGQKMDEMNAVERHRQLEQLRMDVEKAREEEKRLGELLDEKQKAFLDKLAPIEQGIEKLGKLPVCLGRRRKADEFAVLTKRDERMCSGLVCEAVEAHKRLEGAAESFAAALQQLKTGKLEAEVRALQEKAAEPDTTEEEKAFLQHRVKQLQEDIASLVPNATADAKAAEKDLMLTLEMRNVLHYSSALHIAAAMQQQLDADPENKDLQAKVLRTHVQYEQARLAMMRDLDLAMDIFHQKTYGREIYGLTYEKKSDEFLARREQERTVEALAECRERYDATARRRIRLRKKLLLYKEVDAEDLASRGITSSSVLNARMQLVSEAAQLKFYNERMKRLQGKLKTLHQQYADKLAEAKEQWREARQVFLSASARRLALGGDPASFESDSFSQRNLTALEDYQTESDEEVESDELLKDVDDDTRIADEDLLDLDEAPEFSLHQIFSADTTGDEKEVIPADMSILKTPEVDEEPRFSPNFAQKFSDKLRALEGDDLSSEEDSDHAEETDEESFDALFGPRRDSSSETENEEPPTERQQEDAPGDVTEESTAAPPVAEPEHLPSAAEGVSAAEAESSSQQSQQQGDSATTNDGVSGGASAAKAPMAEEEDFDDGQSSEGAGTTQEETQPGSVPAEATEGQGQEGGNQGGVSEESEAEKKADFVEETQGGVQTAGQQATPTATESEGSPGQGGAQQQGAAGAKVESSETKTADEDKATGGDKEGGEGKQSSQEKEKPPHEGTEPPQGETPPQAQTDQGTGEQQSTGDVTEVPQKDGVGSGDQGNAAQPAEEGQGAQPPQQQEEESRGGVSQPGDAGQSGSTSKNTEGGQQTPSSEPSKPADEEQQASTSQQEKKEEQEEPQTKAQEKEEQPSEPIKPEEDSKSDKGDKGQGTQESESASPPEDGKKE
ncbi:hypothetical protein Emed_003445 [Eimeria media]